MAKPVNLKTDTNASISEHEPIDETSGLIRIDKEMEELQFVKYTKLKDEVLE